MNIEVPLIGYYISKNKRLKESIEISETPTKDEKLLIEKMMSVDVANMFKELGYTNKAELIKNCNSFRYVQECLSNSSHKHIQTSFCKDRYCPICSHIKSRKETQVLFEVTRSIQKDNNCKNSSLVLATVTQKNCRANELGSVLDQMTNAVKAMMKSEFIFNSFTTYRTVNGKRKKVMNKAICQGTVRHIEITSSYNRDTGEIEYHPHIHILMLVKNIYFNKSKGYFWNQDVLCEKWQKYMNLDYIPICDIRKVTDGGENEEAHNVKLGNMKPDGAIKEICKYSTKESDVLKAFKDSDGVYRLNWVQSKEILGVLYKACKHRRFLVYAGIFKTTKERLYGKKTTDDLVADMKDSEIVDMFRSKLKCKKCSSAMIEYVDRYSHKYKYYRKFKNQEKQLKLEKERQKDIVQRILKKRKKNLMKATTQTLDS